ncbi:MAG TPA: hypothetical protein VMH32_07510 [Burkholderiales bacterium]|nr:hypothetical protein [Burkholderiales bacterium]
MEQIVPRWEWRTFAQSFGKSDERLAALKPSGVQESDELYLLSPLSDENAKIRDLLLDIKTLQQVDQNGLEQWRPVMKAAFPLSAADVTKVFNVLGLVPPPSIGAQYTLEQLTTALGGPGGATRVVNVHKKRAHYEVDGCLAEMTEVVADGNRTRTVAIESEDPARVVAAVRKLGLDRFENINYPRGLKQLLGMKS